MADRPTDQLELPFDNTKLSEDGKKLDPQQSISSPSNVISFQDALKEHEEAKRHESIRRILSRAEDVQEG
jgi:phage tail sheath gpL-like